MQALFVTNASEETFVSPKVFSPPHKIKLSTYVVEKNVGNSCSVSFCVRVCVHCKTFFEKKTVFLWSAFSLWFFFLSFFTSIYKIPSFQSTIFHSTWNDLTKKKGPFRKRGRFRNAFEKKFKADEASSHLRDKKDSSNGNVLLQKKWSFYLGCLPTFPYKYINNHKATLKLHIHIMSQTKH